jgi:hypothetical protein
MLLNKLILWYILSYLMTMSHQLTDGLPEVSIDFMRGRLHISHRKNLVVLWIVLSLLLTACTEPFLPAPTAIRGKASPTARVTASQPVLVGREPRLWVPAAETFDAAGLPFKGTFSLDNEDFAQTGNDPKARLARFIKQGRIVSFSHDWKVEFCSQVKQLGVGEFSVELVLFETTQGAQMALEYNRAQDAANANRTLLPTTVGESAYFATGKSKTCDLNKAFAYLIFRRANVMAYIFSDSFNAKTAARVTKDFLEKQAKSLEFLISAEARAHPGSSKTLAAARDSVKSLVVGNKPIRTPTPSEKGSQPEGYGGPSEADCNSGNFFRFEDCARYGMYPTPESFD